MIKLTLQFVCFMFIIQTRNLTTAKTFVNKALNKPTYQSGTLHYPINDDNARWLSAHAVDGRKTCPSLATWQQYSGTEGQDTPWWRVDLGKVFTIDHVIVQGQPSATPPQLKGFRLYITSQNTTNNAAIVYENKNNYGNGIFYINISSDHLQGRYVTIDLPKSQYSNRVFDGPLVICEIEIFTPVSEIARLATVEVSSVLNYAGYDYNKDNVKDNRTTSSNIDLCSCCWASMNEQNPFIQLTLPTSQSFDSVIIIGRSDRLGNDDSTTLAGIVVLTDGRPVDPNLIHRNVSSNTATIQLQSIDTKTIKVSRPNTGMLNNWFLVICEIYIYIDVCPTGRFGYFCDNMCGQCLESSCDSETGQCTSGCQPGYMNEFCNETCTPYHYGNCSQKCGHCRDNSNCNHVNGSCPNGCTPGYKPGNTLCNDECDAGYFGDDCLHSCSRHCTNGFSRCDKVTGACMDGCEPGYLGFDCTTHQKPCLPYK